MQKSLTTHLKTTDSQWSMVNRDRMIRTEVNFTLAVTEPVWVITLTAAYGAVASIEERPPLANAMFGAAKISIDHIDRRIGLRCSAVGRTLIRQRSVS